MKLSRQARFNRWTRLYPLAFLAALAIGSWIVTGNPFSLLAFGLSR